MKLELLVGPIASGKSTYCKQASEEGAVIVNDDSIVIALHAGNYHFYDEKLKPLYKSVENNIIQTALLLGQRVIVDRPNHSRAMRRRYIGIGKSLDVPVDIIMMKRFDPSVHANRRVQGDNRGYGFEYWLEVAVRQDAEYEPPDFSEGFDQIMHWNFKD